MDKHPKGWLHLYETPHGMICLYGKVLIHDLFQQVIKQTYLLVPHGVVLAGAGDVGVDRAGHGGIALHLGWHYSILVAETRVIV